MQLMMCMCGNSLQHAELLRDVRAAGTLQVCNRQDVQNVARNEMAQQMAVMFTMALAADAMEREGGAARAAELVLDLVENPVRYK